MKLLNYLTLLSFILLFTACAKDEPDANNDGADDNALAALNLPSAYFNYANPNLPAHYLIGPVNVADNTPANNAVTDAGATLGRVLFYDSTLSRNYTRSCASCHIQGYGFADPQVLSDGFENGKTGRHSMSIINARYYNPGTFFWDERAATLEDQVLMPIQDDVEMGMTLPEVVSRLQSTSHYPVLFEKAFGSNTIDESRISRALAQFVRSIVSTNSKYDEGRVQVANPQDPFPNFTNQENMGKNIYFGRGRCVACHGTDAHIAPGARNNGLDLNNASDAGVGGITANPNQEGLFKVPSLRNVAVRPPYMHDGRFATLGDVMDHYASGIQNNPNLSPPLQGPDGNVNPLVLSQVDKAALIAFLNTLTDNELQREEKFSNPFK